MILTEINDAIITITLDRPKANAINVETSQKLYQVFKQFNEDSQLRVAILTGVGRFFSAGWDLHAAQQGEAITADHGAGGFAGLTEFFSLQKPIIAAVNGIAYGGGFELALAADLIVCSEQASFALPEPKIGLIADSGGVLRLPKRLPAAIAKEMLFTGRSMSAQEALQWGLVNRVVPAHQILRAAHDLALTLVRSAPLSIAAIKEIMTHTEHLAVEDAYRVLRGNHLSAYPKMLHSNDAQEGMLAFTQKRDPQWSGN